MLTNRAELLHTAYLVSMRLARSTSQRLAPKKRLNTMCLSTGSLIYGGKSFAHLQCLENREATRVGSMETVVPDLSLECMGSSSLTRVSWPNQLVDVARYTHCLHFSVVQAAPLAAPLYMGKCCPSAVCLPPLQLGRKPLSLGGAGARSAHGGASFLTNYTAFSPKTDPDREAPDSSMGTKNTKQMVT